MFKSLLSYKIWKVRIIPALLLAILVLAPINFHYRLVWIYGCSMKPTLRQGDFIVMRKVARLDPDWIPARFEIVTIQTDNDTILKRVIGMPGETIEVVQGDIYVNGSMLRSDPFNQQKTLQLVDNGEPSILINIELVIIGPNSVWVIGDNREDSVYGEFLIKQIRGKLVW